MCHKIPYKNFPFALRKMVMLNQRGFDLKRAYLCDKCGKWHLTSQSLSQYLSHK